MADRSAVEDLTKRRGYVGRGLDHGLLYRRVLHRLEERVRLGAGLHAGAQGLGLLFSGLDGVGRGSSRDDQHDRLHLIFEALGIRLLVTGLFLDGGSDVLFADLEASLYRPRIRLLQTMSAFRRDFSVSGRMPWVSRDFVSCSPVIRIRELIEV